MTFSPKGFSKILYHHEHILQLTKTYMKHFEWPTRQNMKMIDIGTGPGHLLMKVEPIIRCNYSEIICVDRNESMLSHFNSIPKNSKISSRFLDIESEKMPDDLRGRFDFAFSSYCLTYVKNLRQTFKNTNELLQPNGELFFFWCKKCYLYDMYRTLHQVAKWAPYTNDFKDWKSVTDNDDPVGTLRPACEINNFSILKAEVLEEITFKERNVQSFLDMFSHVDFVSERVPKSDLPKYIEDFHKLVQSYISIDEKAEFEVTLPFPTVVVAAKKM
ncbi:hypothetical protein WA026_018857 [Henosepilachna vigintioctopunctata]|uniref:Methyltransferase domain-containing protein n=1 Tax=Henosepilachna vigintioctopunctata TaxID=420089 RepID=A0AAW1UG47_9CUCU